MRRMLNTGYSVQEIIEYFKTYVPVKERIARKFREYQELTEKLKNGKNKLFNPGKRPFVCFRRRECI